MSDIGVLSVEEKVLLIHALAHKLNQEADYYRWGGKHLQALVELAARLHEIVVSLPEISERE